MLIMEDLYYNLWFEIFHATKHRDKNNLVNILYMWNRLFFRQRALAEDLCHIQKDYRSIERDADDKHKLAKSQNNEKQNNVCCD